MDCATCFKATRSEEDLTGADVEAGHATTRRITACEIAIAVRSNRTMITNGISGRLRFPLSAKRGAPGLCSDATQRSVMLGSDGRKLSRVLFGSFPAQREAHVPFGLPVKLLFQHRALGSLGAERCTFQPATGVFMK